MTDSTNDYDCIVVGGGTTGCVIASRLSKAGHAVALFEAGPEDYSDLVMQPLNAPKLHATDLEYKYRSTPQAALGGREIANFGGRLVSGSSGVNYGLWTRCHAVDYDEWAGLVGDRRWSYESLLPYFRRVEHHYRPDEDASMYGFEGYIYTLAGKRNYPLRHDYEYCRVGSAGFLLCVLAALQEGGHSLNEHANGGNPLGIGAYTDIWHNGRRQPSGLVNDLSKVSVFTNSTVAKVLIDPATKVATGIALVSGKTFRARKEVIVTCGSIKTPQLLMLSGVGPEAQLAQHGITLVEDLPVGQGLHDFCCQTLYWRLRHPESGLAVGAPGWFSRSEFSQGMPIEWIVTAPTEADALRTACEADRIPLTSAYASQPRGHVEVFFAYAPLGSGGMGAGLPVDGSIISSVVVGLLPTSRGVLTLRDADPNSNPILDPAYLSTATDRAAMRSGMRYATHAMLDTPSGQSFVLEEAPPQGFTSLTSKAPDKTLDERLAAGGASLFHCAGTAAMGRVVDSECRVKGIKQLRVCDASILPMPLAGKYQCPMYAVAEMCADMILGT